VGKGRHKITTTMEYTVSPEAKAILRKISSLIAEWSAEDWSVDDANAPLIMTYEKAASLNQGRTARKEHIPGFVLNLAPLFSADFRTCLDRGYKYAHFGA
jgi:hypothetical protein